MRAREITVQVLFEDEADISDALEPMIDEQMAAFSADQESAEKRVREISNAEALEADEWRREFQAKQAVASMKADGQHVLRRKGK